MENPQNHSTRTRDSPDYPYLKYLPHPSYKDTEARPLHRL
jgi:hypothetical protein